MPPISPRARTRARVMTGKVSVSLEVPDPTTSTVNSDRAQVRNAYKNRGYGESKTEGDSSLRLRTQYVRSPQKIPQRPVARQSPRHGRLDTSSVDMWVHAPGKFTGKNKALHTSATVSRANKARREAASLRNGQRIPKNLLSQSNTVPSAPRNQNLSNQHRPHSSSRTPNTRGTQPTQVRLSHSNQMNNQDNMNNVVSMVPTFEMIQQRISCLSDAELSKLTAGLHLREQNDMTENHQDQQRTTETSDPSSSKSKEYISSQGLVAFLRRALPDKIISMETMRKLCTNVCSDNNATNKSTTDVIDFTNFIDQMRQYPTPEAAPEATAIAAEEFDALSSTGTISDQVERLVNQLETKNTSPPIELTGSQVASLLKDRARNKRFLDVFRFLDCQHRGKFDKQDLKDALLRLRIRIPDEHNLDVAWNELDVDRDGFVDIQDLQKSMEIVRPLEEKDAFRQWHPTPPTVKNCDKVSSFSHETKTAQSQDSISPLQKAVWSVMDQAHPSMAAALPRTHAAARELLLKLDTDVDTAIATDEFKKYLIESERKACSLHNGRTLDPPITRESSDAVADAIVEMADRNHDGYIDSGDLRYVAEQLGSLGGSMRSRGSRANSNVAGTKPLPVQIAEALQATENTADLATANNKRESSSPSLSSTNAVIRACGPETSVGKQIRKMLQHNQIPMHPMLTALLSGRDNSTNSEGKQSTAGSTLPRILPQHAKQDSHLNIARTRRIQELHKDTMGLTQPAIGSPAHASEQERWRRTVDEQNLSPRRRPKQLDYTTWQKKLASKIAVENRIRDAYRSEERQKQERYNQKIVVLQARRMIRDREINAQQVVRAQSKRHFDAQQNRAHFQNSQISLSIPPQTEMAPRGALTSRW